MSWQTIYHHYDEDALVVFANTGLLRRARKDVDSGKVAPLKATQDSETQNGVFSSDGHQVVLNAQGIQQAQCDCSSSGCCKHILAAILWLQANNAEITPAEQIIEATPTPSSPLLPELLALSPAELIKQTGKANCRLTMRLLQQWERDQNQIHVEDMVSQLKIYLPEFEEPVIFLLESGYEGMLSSFPEHQRKALHLAAVAKLFQQHQKPWQWPDYLDIVPNGKRSLSEDEKNLIATINQVIQDILRQGLSHVSRSSAAQLHLLNMSARSEGLPLLASYLRGLSGQVKLLADRHFTMDEGQVLRFLAQISAYLYRLNHASPEQLMTLRGQLRKHYDEKSASLSLIPISANWWTSNGGAQGTTFTFWDNEEKQLLQSIQARANQLDNHFNRHGVWSTLSMWKMTADKLMRRPFSLHSPKLSDEGKLSASGDSYAESQSSFLSMTQYQSLRPAFGIQDWSELTGYFSRQPDGFLQPVLLHIENYQSLIWYEIEQCVIWEINDQHNNSAFLRLYWEESKQSSLEELRYITQRELGILAVCVQPVRQEQHIDLIPTTLWLKSNGLKNNELKNNDDVELFYLDFDHYPRKKKQSTFISHIQDHMAKKKRHNAMHHSEPTLAQKLCRPIFSVLETQACTGRHTLSPSQKEQLELSRQAAEELGLDLLASCLKSYLTLTTKDTGSLLRLIWLCDRLQQLQSQLPLQLHNG
ncbi:SWIM zinc finger family protein [Xenorhabdus szentirmaii]|uniref:SWIM zinc finger family protein n=1 Tax=Xenorhabdus szentirmaii TaxID=290112 RepID=UPI0032B7BC3B